MKLPPNHVPGVGIANNGAFGGFGQKMLEKMGWTIGEGLGRNRDGIRQAIIVKEKHDTQGLGAVQSLDWSSHPWSDVYERSLSRLKQTESDNGDVSDTSTEDSETWWRMNPDGTSSTAKKEELRIYALLSKGSRIGRWSSRNGKLERIRRQERLLNKSSTFDDVAQKSNSAAKKHKQSLGNKRKKTRTKHDFALDSNGQQKSSKTKKSKRHRETAVDD